MTCYSLKFHRLIFIFFTLFSNSATAIVIDGDKVTLGTGDVGQMFDVTYTCEGGTFCNGGTPDETVSAAAWWTLDSLSATAATFTIVIENTTATSFDSTLTAFGVGVITPPIDVTQDPAVTVTNDSTGDNASVDWDADVTTTFPGFQQVDLCVFGGTNCTGGGASGGDPGLDSGQQDTLTLSLAGDYSAGIMLQLFPIKYQGVESCSDGSVPGCSIEFSGVPGLKEPPEPPDPGGGTGVPEPSVLALFGVGMLGMSLMRRRRKQD